MLYFEVSLDEEGSNEVIIRNNRYDSMKLDKNLIVVVKPDLSNLLAVVEGNTFTNVVAVAE